MLPSLTVLTHRVVADVLAVCAEGQRRACPGPRLVAVDGTCGNGHDTMFLADACAALLPHGGWDVLSFDVQPVALENARTRLEKNACAHGVHFFQAGHEHLAEYLPPAEDSALFVVAMYNLGFLPGSDRRCITRPDSTLASLEACRERLAPGGVIAIHTYAGHPGGLDEALAVEAWCRALPPTSWAVARYAFCNRTRNPETAFLAQRKTP